MRIFSVQRFLRIVVYVFMMLPLLYNSFTAAVVSAESSSTSMVYVVPVENTIERGLYAYMKRAFSEAEEQGARHIILEINTPGGVVQAAGQIGELIHQSSIPVTAFVNPDAISAGAFIALNADQIIMVPMASMGAATVVDLEGNAGDAKTMSYWLNKMGRAAEVHGRDRLYAEAMVDPELEIEGVTVKGKPLTFDAEQAMAHGYAEAILSSRAEVLQFLGLENAQVVEVEISAAEHLARFITHPVVVSILFSLASLGLILELYSPGFGLPGIIGLSSLLLFFFGHMVAGFAGWEAVLLFVVGVVLIIIEIIMPGFGIFGILGIVALISSLAMASVDIITGLKAVAVAILVSIIAIFFLGKGINKRGMWSKLVLTEAVSSNEGASIMSKKLELVGQQGITLTKLRPAGIVRIANQRYDVVSDGGFIEINEAVKVIQVEGTRIVVTKLDSGQKHDESSII